MYHQFNDIYRYTSSHPISRSFHITCSFICFLQGSSSECNKLLVAAIDFGTTYSGWAFSFKHEYESDPTRISSRQWYGGQHVSLKVTTVRVTENGCILPLERTSLLCKTGEHFITYQKRHIKICYT